MRVISLISALERDERISIRQASSVPAPWKQTNKHRKASVRHSKTHLLHRVKTVNVLVISDDSRLNLSGLDLHFTFFALIFLLHDESNKVVWSTKPKLKHLLRQQLQFPTFIASLSSHASKCAGLFIIARTSFSKFPVSSDFRSWIKS